MPRRLDHAWFDQDQETYPWDELEGKELVPPPAQRPSDDDAWWIGESTFESHFHGIVRHERDVS